MVGHSHINHLWLRDVYNSCYLFQYIFRIGVHTVIGHMNARSSSFMNMVVRRDREKCGGILGNKQKLMENHFAL